MTAAIGMMIGMLQLHQVFAQGDVPIPLEPNPVPTVPEKGVGGPEAVDLDPKLPQAEPTKMGAVVRTDLTIPEIVAGAMDFTTLAGALRAAGLEERLKADGPLTLLAPDNDAFAAMPEGVLPVLMKPENLDLLRKILTYHIIPKKLKAEELVPANYVTSEGEALIVTGRAKGEMAVQGVGFGLTDVMAKNGVIHVVKAVLIPPSVKIEDYVPAKAVVEP